MAKNSSDKGKSAKKPSSAQNKSASPVGDAFGKAKDWLKAHNIYSKKFYKKHGKGKSWIAKFATSFVAMLTTVVVVAVVLINVYGARYGLGFFEAVDILAKVMRSNDNVQRNNEELGISNEAEKMYTGVKNIMLYGIDSRTMSEESRSDAIMMLTVDMDNKKIKMTSFARDTYVTIPGYYKDKLNHAFVLGWHKTGNIADGATLSMNTINSNFDLNVKDYITVNFWALADIIDYIGGVEIDVSAAERRDINWRLIPHIQDMGIKCEKIPTTGLQLLSGGQALAYCRERYIDGDVERGARQREVLTAMFAKAGALDSTMYTGLLQLLLSECKTSLEFSQLWDLGMWAAGNMSSVKVENLGLPTADIDNGGTYINGVWYYTYDLDKAKQKIQEFILETPAVSTEQPAQ